MTQQLNVAIDEEVYRALRLKAAALEISMRGLVEDALIFFFATLNRRLGEGEIDLNHELRGMTNHLTEYRELRLLVRQLSEDGDGETLREQARRLMGGSMTTLALVAGIFPCA